MRAGVFAAALCVASVAQDLPVIKVTSRLVQVDVIVRDSKGPVTGLTQDDFRLLDQGKPQKIALFQIARTEEPPAPARTPAAGITTNQPATGTAESTVLLLDGTMTTAMEQWTARQQLTKFLAKVNPADHIAIYLLNGGVQLVQPFTGDAAMLLRALDVQQWGAGYLSNPHKPDAAFTKARALTNAEFASLVKGAGATFISNHGSGQGKQIAQECIALIALARHLARVPGRKNLFWFTDGFPLVDWNDSSVYTTEVSQVNHAFNDADVAVYPIDPRGLIPPANATAPRALPSMRPATGSGAANAPSGVRPVGMGGQDTAMFVARYTGGKAYQGYNDLMEPIRKIRQATAVTYTLGFYPDSSALDSKRHALKVEVDRKGVELSYRLDYAATPEAPEMRIPEQAEITEAIWSPVDATGIQIRAQAEKVDQPQPGLVQVTLAIGGGDVTFQPGESGWSGALALLFEERSADGRDMGRISETLNLQYDEEHYKTVAADGVSYKKLVRPAAEAAQVRVVVYDRGSGRVGSVVVHW